MSLPPELTTEAQLEFPVGSSAARDWAAPVWTDTAGQLRAQIAQLRGWLVVGLAGLMLILSLAPLQTLWMQNRASILLNRHAETGEVDELFEAESLLERRAGAADSMWRSGLRDTAFWRTYGAAASRDPSERNLLRLLEARNDGLLDRIGLLWLGEVAAATGHWGDAHEAYVRLEATNLLIQRGDEALRLSQRRRQTEVREEASSAAASGKVERPPGDVANYTDPAGVSSFSSLDRVNSQEDIRATGRNWYTLAAASVEAAQQRESLTAGSIGRLQAVAPHEDDILRAPGGRAISLLRIGRGFLGLGYPEEALPVLEKAIIEMQADSPGLMERQSIQLALAEALARVHPPGRFVPPATRERVANLVEEALIVERSAGTLLEAAAILRTAGERKAPLALMKEALSRAPHLAEAYLALGALYDDRGYQYLAKDIYRQAAEKLGDDPRITGELAKLTYITGNPRAAIPLFEKAIQRGSLDHRIFTYLGDARLALGDVRGAGRAYREAQSLVPYSRTLDEKISRLQMARKTGP